MLDRRSRYRDVGNLSTELGTTGSSGGGSSSGSSTGGSHLHGHDTTEWTGIRWVDDLDQADTGLSTGGTGAGGASWDGGSEWVVLVDVGSTLHDTEVDKSSSNQ